jgi:hypothetical protein
LKTLGFIHKLYHGLGLIAPTKTEPPRIRSKNPWRLHMGIFRGPLIMVFVKSFRLIGYGSSKFILS